VENILQVTTIVVSFVGRAVGKRVIMIFSTSLEEKKMVVYSAQKKIIDLV
jgi:hypothetical protein